MIHCLNLGVAVSICKLLNSKVTIPQILLKRGHPFMRRAQGILTPREQQILELIGKGRTSKEIAEILDLSTGTVGNHRKVICRKLGTHSTAELVYRATLADLARDVSSTTSSS
jgi:DNA-binding NarL/FixJ family response regulator